MHELRSRHSSPEPVPDSIRKAGISMSREHKGDTGLRQYDNLLFNHHLGNGREKIRHLGCKGENRIPDNIFDVSGMTRGKSAFTDPGIILTVTYNFVIPAKAGIQLMRKFTNSRLNHAS